MSFTEGDSVYLAPEFMYEQSSNITYKVDIFSLGLSILQILTGVKLPKNGGFWQELRSKGVNDQLLNLIHSNDCKFRDLITLMTNVQPTKRWSISQFFCSDYFPELKNRFILLNNLSFTPFFDPCLNGCFIDIKQFQNDVFSKLNYNIKRSDSSNMNHYLD